MRRPDTPGSTFDPPAAGQSGERLPLIRRIPGKFAEEGAKLASVLGGSLGHSKRDAQLLTELPIEKPAYHRLQEAQEPIDEPLVDACPERDGPPHALPLTREPDEGDNAAFNLAEPPAGR